MGKKILLADDSITIQKVIELTFSDEDFEVVTVGNGRLAIERVQEVRPDLVLCDIIMPEKDGYEVCDFIKKTDGLSHIPVLLLTGAFEPFDQERAARVRCDGFLAKPFEPQTLIAKVKDLLSQASARPAPAARPAASNPAPAAAPAAAPPPAPQPVAAATPVAQTPASPAALVEPPAPAPVLETEMAFIPDEPSVPTAGAAEPPPEIHEAEPAATEAIGFDEVPYFDTSSPAPGGGASTAAEPYFDEPPVPARAAATPEPEIYEPLDEMDAEAGLPPVTAEESATLSAPPAEPAPAPEPIRHDELPVLEASEPAPWSQPTIEVPLEMRAQASVESAQQAAAAEGGGGFFEEVFSDEPPMASEAPVAEPEADEGLADFEARTIPPTSAEKLAELAPPSAPLAAPPRPAPEPAEVEELEDTLVDGPVIEQARVAQPPEVDEWEPAPERRAPEPMSVVSPVPESSFADVAEAVPAPPEPAAPVSAAAEVPVPMDMVEKIAQRVVAQISEKVIREIAWEVIPDLAEALIKREIERLKSELQS